MADRIDETIHEAETMFGFTMQDGGGDADKAEFSRLAGLSRPDYDRERDASAQRLRIRVSTLDREVDHLRNLATASADTGSGRGVLLRSCTPSADAVDLADVLDELEAAILRHLVMTAEAASVTALWIAHTWVYERFSHTPRFAITSPVKRCGKSTLLAILDYTCRRPLKADNISASGVFRVVEALRPLTMLLDEADTFARENEELRGVLNSGFEASGSVIRVMEIQGEHQPVRFATFCPVAMAAIGDLPGTLADRAVPVRMARKADGDKVDKMRVHGATTTLENLARKLARWADDHGARLARDVEVPDALNDREADISVPLLSIAEQAGGIWPKRARNALLFLFGLRKEDDEGAEAGTMLLTDLRAIFKEQGAARLPSVELCNRLGDMENRPWPEWKAGKPITPRQVAVILRPFGVRPTTYREGKNGPVVKGYIREHFADAWTRYLGVEPEDGGSER